MNIHRLSNLLELVVFNARIVTDDGVVENGVLRAVDGVIEFVGPQESMSALTLSPQAQLLNAAGSWLLPGFIDLHVHGGYGADFMDANEAAYDTITRFHAKHGTTAMLATTVTAPHEALENVFAAVADYTSGGAMPYAQLLGMHLEGPFISPKRPGAQNPSYIEAPRRDWLEAWEARYPGLLRLLTLAPEREGALEAIAWLRDRGIVAACGHTDADYAAMQAAVGAGLTHAAHTFNAMKGLHHREPGAVGAVLTDERVSAEVIADGHHVHPAAVRLLTMVKQQRNLLLITDAIAAAGLGDGVYRLGGLDVVVHRGAARLKDGDSLAGSTLTMIEALRFMVKEVGISVSDASRLASGNPAKQLRLDDRLGSIAPGKQADLLLVGSGLELERVWVRGKELIE